MSSSLVTTFNLVCQDKLYLHLIQSTYMAGIVVATLVGGFCSDHFGRRTTLLGSSLLHCIASFITAFSNDYNLFIMIRFLVGGSAHVMWSSIFVLIMESVNIEMRSLAGLHMNMAWNFGSLLMVGICYALRDWRNIQIAFASIALLSTLHLWVCESPRWLLKNRKIKEADKSLRRIAAFNGVDLESTEYLRIFEDLARHAMSSIKEEDEDKSNTNSGVSLFKKVLPLMEDGETRRRFLVLMIPFFCIGTSSYGIHFAAKLIPFNIFLVCVYKDLLIAFAALVGFFIFKKVQRIPYLLCCYGLTGVIGVTFIFLQYDVFRIIVYGILQSLVIACFYFIDIYTPEVFPTNVRSQAFSILDCWSKVGSAICTFILDIGTDIHEDFPLVIFGILLLFASVTFLFLPETKGIPLADNYEDLKKSKSFFHRKRSERV
nr:solute carrier family 22 member 1-like [Lepeophtheirus salmonis]